MVRQHHFTHSQHRLAACLTLWAMVLALLAPGVSRALAFASGQMAPWGAICTAAPDGRMAADADPATPSADMLQACALCVLGHDAPPLPAQAPAAMRLSLASTAATSMVPPAPAAAAVRLAAQPRAPPSSSRSTATA
jgi:hypothetical protein